MRYKKYITFLWLFIANGCVQKTYTKTINFILDVKDVKNIKTVGIRGNDKPLNWNYSAEMTPEKKDTTYILSATFLTGYKFTEVKFTVNDEFELKDKSNRRIFFTDKDTTIYKAIFNAGE